MLKSFFKIGLGLIFRLGLIFGETRYVLRFWSGSKMEARARPIFPGHRHVIFEKNFLG